MPLKKIQDDVHQWTGRFTPQYWPPHEILAHLMEEVGELGREINHLYGSKKKKAAEQQNNLGKELSDVLFALVCMANSHGIDLQAEWDRMLKERLYGRDKDRYEKK